MDTKIETQHEDAFSGNIDPQNETELLPKAFTMMTNSDAVLLDDNCKVAIKTEIKSEISLPDFSSQKHPAKQIEFETVTCGNNYELDTKTEVEQLLVTDIGPQYKRELLPEDSVINVQKYNIDHKMDNKLEIKEEPWWLKIQPTSTSDAIKGENFHRVKSSRLCIEAISSVSNDKSSFPSAEDSERNTTFYIRNDHSDCDSQESDVTEMSTVDEPVQSDQASKCYGGEVYSTTLYLRQGTLICKSERQYKCNICEKSFTQLSNLKKHNLIHEGKKPYQCKTCEKSFTQLSTLKMHNFVHEDKKPHQCKSCDKSFTRFSYLKIHNLTHEGKKPHQCSTCDKSFTRMSDLKVHYLIHEGKKPHQCNTCGKNFSRLSNLKMHNFVHEGKKPYQCKTCDKSFTDLSSMKRHELIHEGKKPHQCEACDKSFTRLSTLKIHNLIHEGKKPYHCKTCDKSFTQLSDLKRHNLIHEGKKLHQCKICGKSFTQSSYIKIHNLIHEGKKPYQCKICGKSFTRSSYLKMHNLIHEGKKSQHYNTEPYSFVKFQNI